MTDDMVKITRKAATRGLSKKKGKELATTIVAALFFTAMLLTAYRCQPAKTGAEQCRRTHC